MSIDHTVNWADRWIGGFCAVAAIGGLPVRGADYGAHPPLAALLALPPATIWIDADHESAQAAWSRALGGAPVLLIRSAARARELLLLAAGAERGEPIGVPANGDRQLVESVKRYGARPLFLDLDRSLAPAVGEARRAGARLIWAQPYGGAGGIGAACWADCADTLPSPRQPSGAQATLYGLHLAADEEQAGALLVLDSPERAAAIAAHMTAKDTPDPSRALTQLRRLADMAGAPGLASRQREVLAEARRGLHDASGLELLPECQQIGLPQHVAVRIPDESDPATLYAYIRAEETPVHWLPLLRPLHYAAVREPGRGAATAAELARWLLVPAGPGYTDEEIKHAVLGVVKAAEYLGVRWRSDPARAADYAALMDELYGPEHDAYRPAFALAPQP